jgi:DNA-binding winged helix-turn-helix (wHTH) protein
VVSVEAQGGEGRDAGVIFQPSKCEEIVQDQPSRIHQFGDITVDPAGMRVRKGSEVVALEPRSLKVLLYLIENRDRLVTKEELLRAVCQDTFVSDNALTRTVAQIRKALGDDAKQGRIIETVPRLGYRFIAETPDIARKTDDGTVMAPPRASNAQNWLYGLAALLALLAGALIAVQQRMKPKPAAAKQFWPAQFTTSRGLDIYPAFAPDGGSVAYSSDESGTFEIYVKPVTRGARIVQVTSDRGQNVQPAWSPDGRHIAYHRASEDGVWIVPALGGSPRRLAEFGNAPAWSPDGMDRRHRGRRAHKTPAAARS